VDARDLDDLEALRDIRDRPGRGCWRWFGLCLGRSLLGHKLDLSWMTNNDWCVIGRILCLASASAFVNPSLGAKSFQTLHVEQESPWHLAIILVQTSISYLVSSTLTQKSQQSSQI
jgi:hypothetical protein